jgi:hypothetical protein
VGPSRLQVSPSPAGAVAGASCKTLTGTAKLSPGLPPLSSKALVKATITIKGAKLSGCTGGVTSGALSATLKYGIASNCSTTVAGKTANIKGTATVVWNNKKTSTIALSLVGVTKKPTETTIPGTVTAGMFKGSKSSGTVVYTLAKNNCGTLPFSSATFKSLTKVVI